MKETLTNKEILIRLLDRTEDMPSIRSSIENIDKHLEALNSKVAAHEKQLLTFRDFRTKVVTYGSLAILFVPYFINRIL